MSRRVLIIAYHYPPLKGSSGIQRTLKFSSYLREHGWEPMILTASPRAYERVSDDQLGEIPPGVVLHRAFALDTSRHLAIRGRYSNWLAQPDRWVTWWPAAVWRGLRMIRRHEPLAILSTYPIATAHLIGLTLARLSGLPWIADCRDSMTEPGYPSNPLTWKTNRRLERAMVERCARAVFTAPGTLRMYTERYPNVPQSRWSVIENGYDEDNFRGAERALHAAGERGARPLTLVHSGILYSAERDPRPFFAALAKLKAAGEISAGRLRVVLRASGNDDEYARIVRELKIADIVSLEPPVAYTAALQEMLRADALLLFQGRMCNHQIPAKLYEYFRAGRPIFTLADPTGDTANSLRAAGSADIADIDVEDEIARNLLRFLAALEAGAATGVRPEVAAQSSRRARTAQLAQLLDAVVAERASAQSSTSAGGG